MNREDVYKRVGVHLGFIATRSGLMRFVDHSHLFIDPEEEEMKKKKKKKQQKDKGSEDDEGKLDEP